MSPGPAQSFDASTRLGQVDMVLVAVGALGDQATDEVDTGAVARMLSTEFTVPAAVSTAFASVLREQGHGRIVVLSSVAGVCVRRANYLYGASKAGLDAFAQGMAEALRGSGASLMIVRPGWVATRMTEGRDPPLATTADAVAGDVVRGMERSSAIVWSPGSLRIAFALLRSCPGGCGAGCLAEPSRFRQTRLPLPREARWSSRRGDPFDEQCPFADIGARHDRVPPRGVSRTPDEPRRRTVCHAVMAKGSSRSSSWSVAASSMAMDSSDR